MKRNTSILRLTQIALLTALIVVLQIVGAMLNRVIPFLPFNLSFVLIPIVVGSLLLGVRSGALLGGIFGLIVVIQCATAIDPSGFILWGINPFFTILICMVKGIAAGAVPALVAKLFKKQTYLSTTVAALCAPVVNTGLFCIGMLVLFHGTLVEWASGSNALLFCITGLAGINFIIEFVINAIFAPAILRIVNTAKKTEI